MKKLFLSPLFNGLLGGSIFLVTLFLVGATAATRPPKTEHPISQETPIWNPQNSEIDQLVTHLKNERDDLRERESRVTKLEEQLKTERIELDEVSQRLKEMQDEFDKNVVQLKVDELGNLKKQAKMYASMSPDSAGQILAQMEDAAVVKLLASMKEEESALILEGILKRDPQSAKRAAAISDQLRRVLVPKANQK